MTTKKTTASKVVEKKPVKKIEKKKPFVWNKGSNVQRVRVGEGSEYITFRGLTYRELLHIAPMEHADADILTLRIAITKLEGLKFDDNDIELKFENYDYNGKTIKVVTDQCFDDIFGSRLFIIAQSLELIKELSGNTVEEAKSVKFFRC